MPLDPPNLPSVSRIVGHWSTDVGGANAISVWHVLSNGIAALEVFNRFSTAWDVNQLSVTTAHARLHTLDVTRLDLQSATESFTTVGTEWAGGVVGEYSPATAVLVKYSTGFRGLASVGHTFVPFVAEEAMENGQVLPAALPALATAWVTFVNTLTSQTIPLQVVSYGRADHATLPDAPATNHTVTACTVSGILATQRNRQSRLRG